SVTDPPATTEVGPAATIAPAVWVTLPVTLSAPAAPMVSPPAAFSADRGPARLTEAASWINRAVPPALVVTLPGVLTAPSLPSLLTAPAPALTALAAPWLTPRPVSAMGTPALLTIHFTVSAHTWI